MMQLRKRGLNYREISVAFLQGSLLTRHGQIKGYILYVTLTNTQVSYVRNL